MSYEKEDCPLKRIKDFIYDHNDLLVALVIILAAGALIYGRMNLILDYPAKVSAMSNEGGQTLTGKVDDPNAGGTPVDPAPGTDDPNGGTTPGGDDPNGGTTPGGDDPNGGTTPGGDNNPPQPVTEYISFHISAGEYSGWESLAKGLQYAGIVGDYLPLYRRVLERVNLDGIEGYNFYAGTYRLPKGADVDTLIDILRDVSKVTSD